MSHVSFLQSTDIHSAMTLLVYVTLILIAARLVTLLWRSASASQRHLVWSVACYGVLLVPMFQWLIPKHALYVLPSLTLQAPVTRVVQAHAWGASAVSVTTVVLLLWSVGALLVLIPLLRSWRLVNRFVADASPCTSLRVRRIADDLIASVGGGRRVVVKMHPSAVPTVCGVFRHVILLPQCADTWTEERLRHVLLHEIAHITRYDSVTQAAASLAGALYWFHPLVWFAARELRRERELACDDIVLATGSAPARYATDLLDITLMYTRHQAASLAAMPFAETAHMHGRLDALLDTSRLRTLVSRRATVMTWGVALGVMCPLVSLTLQPRMVDQGQGHKVAHRITRTLPRGREDAGSSGKLDTAASDTMTEGHMTLSTSNGETFSGEMHNGRIYRPDMSEEK